MDDERNFELQQLQNHAVDYYKARNEGFEGDYADFITRKKEIECEECGEKWNEQELDSYSWHCLKCGQKIGD